MIGKLTCGLVLLLCCGVAGVPAAARECGPLKMLASSKLIAERDYRQAVPVTINGVPKQFILDTGGVFTQVGPDAARDLHLAAQSGATQVYDVSGNASGGFAKIDSFELGGIKAKDLYLRISPSNLGADGIVAPDVMKSNDVEMDFAGGKMNYFQQDHCVGKVVYWQHDGGVAQVPIVLADPRWIKVPVELDGKSLMAIIDTGAAATTITSQKAQEVFGLTPASPDMVPAGNVNGDPNLASYSHKFTSLSLDGIAIRNLRMIVMPDRLTEEKGPRYRYYFSSGVLYSQKRIEAPDLILGMDVLKHLHLYFAFGEHNLYATAAPLPSLPPPTQAQAADAPKLSPPVLVALREAQAAIKKNDFPAAMAGISKARAATERSPFDDFAIHRFALVAELGLKDFPAAATEAEAAADADPGVIPDNEKASVYKAALQLSLHEQDRSKAAHYAALYQTTNPPDSDKALISAGLGGKVAGSK